MPAPSFGGGQNDQRVPVAVQRSSAQVAELRPKYSAAQQPPRHRPFAFLEFPDSAERLQRHTGCCVDRTRSRPAILTFTDATRLQRARRRTASFGRPDPIGRRRSLRRNDYYTRPTAARPARGTLRASDDRRCAGRRLQQQRLSVRRRDRSGPGSNSLSVTTVTIHVGDRNEHHLPAGFRRPSNGASSPRRWYADNAPRLRRSDAGRSSARSSTRPSPPSLPATCRFTLSVTARAPSQLTVVPGNDADTDRIRKTAGPTTREAARHDSFSMAAPARAPQQPTASSGCRCTTAAPRTTRRVPDRRCGAL